MRPRTNIPLERSATLASRTRLLERKRDADELARKALQNKIEKLEAFSCLATDLATELKKQLDPSI